MSKDRKLTANVSFIEYVAFVKKLHKEKVRSDDVKNSKFVMERVRSGWLISLKK